MLYLQIDAVAEEQHQGVSNKWSVEHESIPTGTSPTQTTLHTQTHRVVYSSLR